MAFTIPIRQKIPVKTYIDKLFDITNKIRTIDDDKSPILSKEQLIQIANLETCTIKVKSPLQYLEQRLHGWVAYFILPIFALANAGVTFNSDINLDYSLITSVRKKTHHFSKISYIRLHLPGIVPFKTFSN